MKFYKIILTFCFIFLLSKIGLAQKPEDKKQSVKSSPAYSEILLRKVELESEIESLLVTYKEDFPKIKELKYELSLLQKDLDKLLLQTDTGKLTLALGKLLVRKNQLETDYWALQIRYGDDHPEVKRAKRKVTIFQNSINEIL